MTLLAGDLGGTKTLLSLCDDRGTPLYTQRVSSSAYSGLAEMVEAFLREPEARALPTPTQTAKTLFAVGRDLLAREATGRPWRLIGIGLTELLDAGAVEHDLFAEDERRALLGEQTVDRLKARFGPGAVTSGRALGAKPAPKD